MSRFPILSSSSQRNYALVLTTKWFPEMQILEYVGSGRPQSGDVSHKLSVFIFMGTEHRDWRKLNLLFICYIDSHVEERLFCMKEVSSKSPL